MMSSRNAQQNSIERTETIIEPRGGWHLPDLGKLWAYRELVGFLVWRDVKVRYRQTFFGAAWALVPPFVTMVVFTFVFGSLVRVSSDGHQYWAFSIAALIIWTYFSQSLTLASGSVISNSTLIGKIYFPRLTLPLAAVIAPLLDLCLALAFLFPLLAFSGFPPSPRLLLLVPLVLIALIAAAGLGAILAGLIVRYRDVKHVVPLIVQIGLFATPVVYPASIVPEALRPLISLNPMTGVVEGFRWALLGSDTDPWGMIGMGTLVSITLALAGAALFNRLESTFADVI